jgi:hypothetical protein
VIAIESRPCPRCGQPMEPARERLFLGDMVQRRRALYCADPECQRRREMIARRHAFDRGECT